MPRIASLSEPDELTRFGENVREERKLRGWSLQRLARLAGLATDTVFRIEKGGVSTLTSRRKVCTALQSSYHRFLMGAHKQGEGYAVHRAEDDYWFVHYGGKDGRWKASPAAIQTSEERVRLGGLRFVRDFVNLFNCRLQGGKLVSGEMELYGPGLHGSYLGGEAFIYVLEGEVVALVGEESVRLRQGESITLNCAIPFCFSPGETLEKGRPPRILYVRLSTEEVTQTDDEIRESLETWKDQGQGGPTL